MAAAAATVAGIVTMLGARVSSGDTFPIYSSHRADPLGTRVLYEALGQMPGVSCERNYQPVKKLKGGSGDLLIMANVQGWQTQTHCGCDDGGEAITAWAKAGGRVILALAQRPGFSFKSEDDLKALRRRLREEKEKKTKKEKEKEEASAEKADSNKPAAGEKKEQKNDDEEDDNVRYLGCAYDLFLHERRFWLGGDDLPPPPAPTPHLPLQEDEMPNWFSYSYLRPTPAGEGQWHALATKGDRAMVMRRQVGKGDIIVCTDSFFLSNEALWREPHSAFLAWLVGDARRVVFEERAHGVGDDDGIMTLARRYRMHGLFLGGILLFALFVWRNATSLVPPDEAADLGHWRGDAVAGHGAASGLVSMLRRGIKPGELLQKCFASWEVTRAASGRIPAERVDKAREILSAEPSGPRALRQLAESYRKLRDALHPPKM